MKTDQKRSGATFPLWVGTKQKNITAYAQFLLYENSWLKTLLTAADGRNAVSCSS
jgi:hypothetical protein